MPKSPVVSFIQELLSQVRSEGRPVQIYRDKSIIFEMNVLVRLEEYYNHFLLCESEHRAAFFSADEIRAIDATESVVKIQLVSVLEDIRTK